MQKQKKTIQNPTIKKKKPSTPKNKRSRSKYAALDPSLNLKTRTDLIDYDYVNKLTDKEKAWLNKFTQEYVNAGNLTKENKPLHKSKELRKDCYDRNNARNRCQYTRQKASIGNKYLEEYKTVLFEDPTEDMDTMIDMSSTTYYDEYNKLKETTETNVKSNKRLRKQRKQS
jgi:hypothetical protein